MLPLHILLQITRFCLVCNYVTRIIEPLASRCAKFRFRPLSRETMEGRLRSIAQAEEVCTFASAGCNLLLLMVMIVCMSIMHRLKYHLR